MRTCHKLTEEQRRDRDERIRELHKQGLGPTVISKRLGFCSFSVYYRAIRNEDARTLGER